MDQHSRIHFDEEERIEKIIGHQVPLPQKLPEKPAEQPKW